MLSLFVMFVATSFGLDLSLAPGLSVKNAFLYTIIVIYMIETAVFHNRRLELPSVLVPFGLFVGYCILSWFVAAFVVGCGSLRLLQWLVGQRRLLPCAAYCAALGVGAIFIG